MKYKDEDDAYEAGYEAGHEDGVDAAWKEMSIGSDILMGEEKAEFFKLLDQIFEYCEVKIDLTNTHQQEIVSDLFSYGYEVPGIKT